MFDKPYQVHNSGFQASQNEKYLTGTHNFSFKTEQFKYRVKVDHYENDILIIKYHRRMDQGSNRFNILSGEYKCSRIIATCIDILVNLFKKKPSASFGFLGSHTVVDGKPEEKKEKTKRFRVYKMAIENKIGDNIFLHNMDESKSAYLMINRKNPDPERISNEAKRMFIELYQLFE